MIGGWIGRILQATSIWLIDALPDLERYGA
jgi:hypothetical protein